ncbi:MAG: hypothetical protein WC069_07035 [Candidatus Shapirobacteria bacterium]
MAGFCLNMNNLVSNINRCGQKDLSFEVRHKAYARPLAVISLCRNLDFLCKLFMRIKKHDIK